VFTGGGKVEVAEIGSVAVNSAIGELVGVDEVHVGARMHGAVRAAGDLLGPDAGAAQRGAHTDRTLVGKDRIALGDLLAFQVHQILGCDTRRRHALVDRMTAPKIAKHDHC